MKIPPDLTKAVRADNQGDREVTRSYWLNFVAPFLFDAVWTPDEAAAAYDEQAADPDGPGGEALRKMCTRYGISPRR